MCDHCKRKLPLTPLTHGIFCQHSPRTFIDSDKGGVEQLIKDMHTVVHGGNHFSPQGSAVHYVQRLIVLWPVHKSACMTSTACRYHISHPGTDSGTPCISIILGHGVQHLQSFALQRWKICHSMQYHVPISPGQDTLALRNIEGSLEFLVNQIRIIPDK